MAWLSRNNIAPTDSLTADMLNSLANDIRYWGGDVNGGGYKLSNVVLSGTGGFERLPTPAVVAAVTPGGNAQLQLTDLVAGTPDTYPPRWSLIKKALPTPDFGIDRYSAGGTFIDEPFMIRSSDGVIVMKAQQWTGPIDGGGQTISNVILGPSTIAGVQTPWKQNVNAAKFALHNSRGLYTENVATGVPYSSAGLVIYEALSGGLQTAAESPRIAFYHQGIDASQIGFDAVSPSGIRTWTAAGTGYAPFTASRITAYEAPIFLRDAGIGTVTRPPISGLRGKGEIFGALGDTSDWGFVRISAGGGTASAYRAYIDLSGYNTNSEMDRTIVLGLGGEKLRIDVNKTTISTLEFWANRISQPIGEAHAWNASYTDVWRYRTASYAWMTYGSSDGYYYIRSAVSGSAGAPITWNELAMLSGGNSIFFSSRFTVGGPSSPDFYFQLRTFNVSRWLVGVNGANDFFINRCDAGGNNLDTVLSIWTTTGTVSIAKNLIFAGGELTLKISTHAAGFGIGIEAGSQYYLTDVPSKHRWYCGPADDGATDKMELSGTKLTINVATDMKGNLDLGGYAISNFTVGGVAGLVTSFNTRTGAVVPAQGDYPPAKLGTGTPDNTKYLRGDGTWQVPPGAGGGEPQSPWTRNIDAAGYSLLNAGMGDFASTTAALDQPGIVIRSALRGPGPISGASAPRLMFHWAGIGYSQIGMDNVEGSAIRTYTGPGTGWADFSSGKLFAGANIVTLDHTGSGVTIRETGRMINVAPEYAPRLSFWWGGFGVTQIGSDPLVYYGIRTYNDAGTDYASFTSGPLRLMDNWAINLGMDGKFKRNLPAIQWHTESAADAAYLSFAPKAAVGTSVSWHSFFLNISASGMTFGAPQIPKVTISSRYLHTQQVQTPLNSVHAWNVEESTGTWRYIANGAGFHMYMGSDDHFHMKIAPSGSAGGVPGSWLDAVRISPTGQLLVAGDIYKTGDSKYVFHRNSGGYNRWGVGIGASPTNDFEIHRYWTDGSYVDRPFAIESSSGSVYLSRTLMFTDAPIAKIRLYGGFEIGIESATKYETVPTGCAHRWYVGVTPDNGASSFMDLVATALGVRTTLCAAAGNAITLNAHWTNQWTYYGPTPNPAMAIYPNAAENSVRMMVAASGTSGQPISFSNVLKIRPSIFTVWPQFLQVLPTSQTDPTEFGETGNASYMYFDPATKKLIIRHHEAGVAFRNYVLREGDQGTGVAIVNDPSAQSQALTAAVTAIRDSFQVPAGATMVRVTLQISGTASVTTYCGVSLTSHAKGATNLPGGENMIQLTNLASINPGNDLFIDVALVAEGSGRTTLSGSYKVGAGAWQAAFAQVTNAARGLAGNHIVIGMVAGGGATVTSTNYVGTKMY